MAVSPAAQDSVTDPAATDELHVLVLAGGLSYERDVSLRSGRRVLDALRAVGVEAELRDADVALLPALAADPPDAVVIALHGATGEDGSLRGVLDLCDCPTSAATRAPPARLGQAVGEGGPARGPASPPPTGWPCPHDRFSELGAVAVLARIVDRLGLPLMVKPAQGGSGLGAAVVRDAACCRPPWSAASRTTRTALVEPYVHGMDVAVSVVDLGAGPHALPAGRDRAPQRRLRLRRPLHRRPHHLARAGPARRARSPAGVPRWPSPRTARSASGTCPGST